MNRHIDKTRIMFLWLALAAVLATGSLQAKIDGVSAASFALTAKADYISMADGVKLYSWGYALGSGRMQYPGVTMILQQNVPVTVTLKNALPPLAGNASIVFPGMDVTATGGLAGALTQEAPPDGATTVTYTFTPTRPGTYHYHSGTRPDVQVEMGLIGAIIVRPTGFDPLHPRAYEHADTAYDRETLFLITEMDPRIHLLVGSKIQLALDPYAALDASDFLTDYFPNYYILNGRVAPDTMKAAGSMPVQPYDCMPIIHPGDRLLMRVVGGGHDMHPFHFHGAHARMIARDGHLLESVPGVSGPDLGTLFFTFATVPGETIDGIYRWTGKDLGWDVYGTDPAHMAVTLTDANGDGYDDTTWEYIADHGKPLPVILPEVSNVMSGPFFSGSPYLGASGTLPPGEGGLNPNGGYVFMFHSHTEKELTNWGLFPGGLMTMCIIEPPSVPIM